VKKSIIDSVAKLMPYGKCVVDLKNPQLVVVVEIFHVCIRVNSLLKTSYLRDCTPRSRLLTKELQEILWC
jgi:hypothetical protein